MRQRKRDNVGCLLMHKLGKDQRWAVSFQVCICSSAEVFMGFDVSINYQQLPQHLSTAVTIRTAPNQDVKKSPRHGTLMGVLMRSGSFTERRPRAMTSPKFNR